MLSESEMSRQRIRDDHDKFAAEQWMRDAREFYPDYNVVIFLGKQVVGRSVPGATETRWIIIPTGYTWKGIRWYLRMNKTLGGTNV